MPILDPELNILLARKAYYEANPVAGSPVVPADKVFYIAIEFTGDLEALRQIGLTVGSTVGNIAYGATDIAGLEALARHPQVETIKKQRRPRLHLDKSVPDIKANEVWSRSGDNFHGYTGRGVIVGIIDTGIDFRHHSFRDAAGNTRILKLWDQTLTVEGAEKKPDPINRASIEPVTVPLAYGVEYNSDQINDKINGRANAVTARHLDDEGHGTHVAGIAAGDGSQSGTPAGGCHGSYHYVGVATEASLIVVRLWGLSDKDSDVPPLGSNGSNTQIDAIRYILNQARILGKPVVMNLSLGTFDENVDGSSTECSAVDRLLKANSVGTAIVYSAGNEANKRLHASGTVGVGPLGKVDLKFRIKPDDKKDRKIIIVYSGANLKIELTSPIVGAPGDNVIPFVMPGIGPSSVGSSLTANGTKGNVFISDLPNRIDIEITPPTDPTKTPSTIGPNAQGIWKLELQSTDASPANFNAYIHESGPARLAPIFDTEDGDINHVTSSSTLDSEASGKECIAVGSYKVGGRLAASSGRGPTLDTPPRPKPEICAPGVDIVSAGIPSARGGCHLCCCDCCQHFYVSKSGTSMSAPHITGVIALMLHKKPDLTHTDIKSLLMAHPTAKPGDSTPDENVGWGAGKVNAKDVVGVGIITAVNPPVARTMVEPAPQDFDALAERLLQTERGPELFRLFPKHVQEVMALVNSNRRVAAVWHRCKGPVWVRLALRAAHTPGMALPVEVDGLSLREGIWRFSAIVKKYASPAFIEDLLRYEPEFALFEEGMTLENLIDAVGSRSLVPPAISAPSDLRSWTPLE